MSISVTNGGGIVQRNSALFRVLIMLAILAQGGLFVHDHGHTAAAQAQAIALQQ